MSADLAQDETAPVAGAKRRSPLAMLAAVPEWAAAHRLRAALAACSAVACIALAVGAWLWSRGNGWDPGDVTLDTALEALDAGYLDEAKQAAEALRRQRHPPADVLGGAAYVLGEVSAREADQALGRDRRRFHLLAARYLEEARDRGFPPERRAGGLLQLGESLFQSGRYAEARPPLREALEADPPRKTEIHRLLAACYLREANPKCEEALEHNAKFLADPNLLPGQRARGLVQKAEILLRLGRVDECLAALEQVPPATEVQPEAMVLRGRVLMHQAESPAGSAAATDDPEGARAEARQKYHEAVQVLRLAQSRDTLAAESGGKAMYLIGVCLHQTGDARGAFQQFRRTAETHPGTPESLAAELAIAELARELGQDAQALAAFRRVLEAMGDPATFSNPWVSLDGLRRQTMEAYQHYLDAGRFEIALQLARSLGPLFSSTRALELVARTHRAWGMDLLARAEHAEPGQTEALVRQGREQLRRGGQAFARLAELRKTTRAYPDDLWAAADGFFQGQSYEAAAKLLGEYLEVEARHRHAPAMLHLGEALLALGQTDEAIGQFDRLVAYHPRDAAAFQARLAAARACVEKGEHEQAEAKLRENLEGDLLDPTSAEWRDSLFALGRLYRIQGKLDEAALELEEAAARYPEHPAAVEARYLAGDCYARRADVMATKLDAERIASVRAARAEKIAELRTAALAHFRAARDTLLEHERHGRLSQSEQAVLRNSLFAAAAEELNLGHGDAAVKALTAAADRYRGLPPGLEACVQLARAYAKLDQPAEARRALDRAKRALAELKPDEPLTETTNYTRDQWAELLQRLDKTLASLDQASPLARSTQHRSRAWRRTLPERSRGALAELLLTLYC